MENTDNGDAVAKRIQAKRKKIETHERKSKERLNAVKQVHAMYQNPANADLLSDILKKAKAFSAYHVQMSKDGVGYRSTGAKLEDGSPEQELFFFTSEKRVSEIDKAAGIDELINYIERQLNATTPEPTAKTE